MAQKISVVIPNYNGRKLLEKNLSSVLKYCEDCEIVVVDDGSSDDSVDFVEKNFKSVKLVSLSKNIGFAQAANQGVRAASNPLVLLLNSDIKLSSNFLKKAQKYFEDEKVFAVGISDKSHESGKVVIRGRGEVQFKKGFVYHFAKAPTAGETFWVSGGSSIISREKFLKLGGFDKIYAPFYWEDIDLCFRARKAGDVCIFEPEFQVDHYHEEGAIKKNFSSFFVKTISYKNQFIFVWKNISDYTLIMQHILWLPYHFIKALLAFDIAFFVGFLLAVSKIPQLVFDYRLQTIIYTLSDKEVLNAKEEQ